MRGQKTMDRIMATGKVVKVWSEAAQGQGYWAQLRPGYESTRSGCRMCHEETLTELLRDVREAVQR